MKKIAVFTHSLTIEYSLDVLNGISNFFEDKDITLFIAQTRDPHDPYSVYEYQSWSSVEFLFSKQVDAYLVITGSYTSHITVEVLSNHLWGIGNRPVISVGIPINLPNSYYTKVECDTIYEEIVTHLKNKHNRKRIAFMSANQTQSPEALERFEAYKKALEKNGYEYDESLVMDGKFRRGRSKNSILDKYKTKEEVDFDAILCANDSSAVGVQEALIELGVSVPNEVSIFGFDETSLAISTYPKISTVDQNIVQQGFVAASMCYDILMGKLVEKCGKTSATIVYRQSCGCVPLNYYNNVYCNSAGEFVEYSAQKQERLNRNRDYFNFLNGINNIYSLFDLSKAAQTLRKNFHMMKYMMATAQMDSLTVFFLDKPMVVHQNQEYNIEGNVRVSMIIDSVTDTEIYEPGYVFNIKEKFVPEELMEKLKGIFLFHPIFSGEKLYGYIICKPKANDYSIYSVYMKVIVNSLAQAYEFTETLNEYQKLELKNQELEKNNSSLDTQSKTDELTKILNRRGFMELGQKTINLAKEMKSVGLVIFFDMDGLKIINDSFGHEMGDNAIKSMASVLKNALRSNDVLGRLGGDEFGAVAVGIKQTQLRNLRRRIKKLCEAETKQNKYPFKLSCSVGYAEFNENNANLYDLLSSSDELLYKEKKLKHGQNYKKKILK